MEAKRQQLSFIQKSSYINLYTLILPLVSTLRAKKEVEKLKDVIMSI